LELAGTADVQAAEQGARQSVRGPIEVPNFSHR